MKILTGCLAVVALSCASCATYTGVSKADGQIYISGMTSYFVFSTPWVRRCDVDGTTLRCEELTEEEKRHGRGDDSDKGSSDKGSDKGSEKSDKGSDAKPADAKPADAKPTK